MQKRGQISYFIVLGIILLSLSLSVFYVVQHVGQEELKAEVDRSFSLPFYTSSIDREFSLCLEELALPGAYLLAAQGGFVSHSKDVFVTDKRDVASYHFGGPSGYSLSYMASELEDYIEDASSLCIASSGEDLHFEGATADVSIEKSITVDVLVTHSSSTGRSSTSDVRFNLPLNLKKLVDARDFFLEHNFQDTHLDLGAFNYPGVSVLIEPYDRSHTYFSLYGNEQEQTESPFVFQFVFEVNPVEE
tara:strand:+ start:1201 stop:1941 length:741 start_codon:yes stop_codon:yes gene_type:complete